MRIFIITSQIVYPWWFYGRNSMFFLLKHLSQKVDVFLSFPVKSIKDEKDNIEYINKNLNLEVFPFEHNTSDSIFKLMKNIFEEEPFKIKKYFNYKYLDFLKDLVKKINPDIIQNHSTHTFFYGYKISKHFKIPLVLRQHDIVHNQIHGFYKYNKNILFKLK